MNWAPKFLHGVETKEALIQLHVHLEKLWGKKQSILLYYIDLMYLYIYGLYGCVYIAVFGLHMCICVCKYKIIYIPCIYIYIHIFAIGSIGAV